ncbi:hypothetical protein CCC_03910 [Paramagnetospirillum magnetotacticum MS-1]|uniref:Uncharacterized protein n=1 Tax=Paramagnetospirillum magnetotacticum MS-1 TaxID=272627 RepID=A0A0C2YXA4_PARME|nr:hypothetical protein [Paramagnetospirillum magnetotacticum]KIL99738.1 hypothetical protein CCC_03910 [Paramagnetospirillum magnetotacticum MS-1]
MIIKNIAFSVLLCLGIGISSVKAAEVESRIFNKGGIESWCNQSSPRQTVIYVDESIITQGDDKWARQLMNKIHFTPRERVQVVALRADAGTADQRFSLCYPDYSQAELEDLRRGQRISEFFTGTPMDQMRQAREQFDRGFRVALSSFIVKGQASGIAPVQTGPLPDKSIAEAMFYDEKRFATENGVSRLIIFSDMLQNSQSFQPTKENDPAASGIDAARKYAIRFNLAEVHVFGIGSTVPAGDPVNRKMEAFWRAFFLANGAYLEQFSNTLNLGDSRSIAVKRWRGALAVADMHSEVNLRIMTDESGVLVNSWLVVNNSGGLPLEGKEKCVESMCEITAKLRTDVGAFKRGDVLLLRGNAKEMKGALKDPTGAKFSDGKPAEYVIGLVRDDAARF